MLYLSSLCFLSGFYIFSFFTPPISDTLKMESINTLRSVLNDQQEWVKVHAAEFLLWNGHPEGVEEIYLKEEKKWGNVSPYRIGIWRVLYQAATKPEEKKIWLEKIMQAFADTAGADRIHAAETLAKLNVSPLKKYPAVTKATLKSSVSSLAIYTRWSISHSSEQLFLDNRNFFLNVATSPKEEVLPRKLAAYILRNSGDLPFEEWGELGKSALSVPENSDVRLNLLSAALITASEKAILTNLYRDVYHAFLQYKDDSIKSVRIDIAAGLGEKGNMENLPVLIAFLRNSNPLGVEAEDADVRASAAYAILKLKKRLDEKEKE